MAQHSDSLSRTFGGGASRAIVEVPAASAGRVPSYPLQVQSVHRCQIDKAEHLVHHFDHRLLSGASQTGKQSMAQIAHVIARLSHDDVVRVSGYRLRSPFSSSHSSWSWTNSARTLAAAQFNSSLSQCGTWLSTVTDLLYFYSSVRPSMVSSCNLRLRVDSMSVLSEIVFSSSAN